MSAGRALLSSVLFSLLLRFSSWRRTLAATYVRNYGLLLFAVHNFTLSSGAIERPMVVLEAVF